MMTTPHYRLIVYRHTLPHESWSLWMWRKAHPPMPQSAIEEIIGKHKKNNRGRDRGIPNGYVVDEDP